MRVEHSALVKCCYWHGPEYCCGRMRIRSVIPHLALLNLARIPTSSMSAQDMGQGGWGPFKGLLGLPVS